MCYDIGECKIIESLISCPNCGSVFDIVVLRSKAKKNSKGEYTWLVDGKEKWHCRVCNSINNSGE